MRLLEPDHGTPRQHKSPDVEHAVAVGRSTWPLMLVSMPFMDVNRPSIQLGLLKAVASRHGFPARTLHANLDFAARIGVEFYRSLSAHRGRMLGDWLFSVEAFGAEAPDPDGLLLDNLAEDDLTHLGADPAKVHERLSRIRYEDVPAYLEALVDGYPWGDARVVGFSSTFQQNAASFALARRLKARYPDVVTVFGGANFDGDMGRELVRTVECVDLAVIGEGDVALPQVLCALADGTDPAAVPGVARRAGANVVGTAAQPLLRRLDGLPVPDYSEYFERADEFGLLTGAQGSVWIPFESARGCWWGAKHHCTFCGLNGSSMAFRSKSSARVLDELSAQARRHRTFKFAAVDNILDPGYLRDLLPTLIDNAIDYTLFYEVKANLTRAQLRLLAQAGVRYIQPGLESLSSNVLRLMRKGVRAAQTVNLLRWSRYYGIDVAWNILWGFPGETTHDYAEQTAAIPHLLHLQPPAGVNRIWLERFSPLFADPEAFGVRSRSPERSYRYVYPERVDLDQVSYFFEYELDTGVPDETYRALTRAVDEWSGVWRSSTPPALTYWSAPGFLQIYDGRRPGHEGTYTFDGLLADVYLACSNKPATAAGLRDRLTLDLPTDAVTEILIEFQRRGLMFLDGSLAVALALPAVTGR